MARLEQRSTFLKAHKLDLRRAKPREDLIQQLLMRRTSVANHCLHPQSIPWAAMHTKPPPDIQGTAELAQTSAETSRRAATGASRSTTPPIARELRP
jgi:hypothetical protein